MQNDRLMNWMELDILCSLETGMLIVDGPAWIQVMLLAAQDMV